MCDIISNQTETDYNCSTRSVRLMGHVTSIRLENHYWKILDAIAEKEGLATTSQLLNQLHEEILELRGAVTPNFASLLRVGCIKYIAAHEMKI